MTDARLTGQVVEVASDGGDPTARLTGQVVEVVEVGGAASVRMYGQVVEVLMEYVPPVGWSVGLIRLG